MSEAVHAPILDASGQPAQKRRLGLLASSGGARATLGTSGVLLVCDFVDLELDPVGGISGGVLPTVLRAAGMPAREIVRIGVNQPFNSLLIKNRKVRDAVWEYSWRNRYSGICPSQGFYDATKMGQFFESLVPVWPKRFWTLAVSNDRTLIFFCADGVFEIDQKGEWHQLTTEPAPISQAILATTAVPGVFHGVPYILETGEPPVKREMILLDGAIGPQGRRPIAAPVKHFGLAAGELLVSDVGPDVTSIMDVTVEQVWRWIYGQNCVACHNEERLPSEQHGIKIIRADVHSLKAFDFDCLPDRKWSAIMTGVRATAEKFVYEDLLVGDKRAALESAIKEYDARSSTLKSGIFLPAPTVEAILQDHGVL